MDTREAPALLLIDIQKGLDDWDYYGGRRNNPGAEQNMKELLLFWRKHHLPLFHIKHNSAEQGSPLAGGKAGNAFKEAVHPLVNEPVIEKNVNSAFIGTDLTDRLRRLSVNSLVIIGLTTDHCISSTARMAGNLAFETVIVSDATATFDKTGPDGIKYPAELIHQTALASLDGEFGRVISTSEVLAELRRKYMFPSP